MKTFAYIKWFSLALAISSVVLAAWFLWQGSTLLLQGGVADDAQDARNTQIDAPLIVERDGARVLWRLRAEQAWQLPSGMRLIKPQLELFPEGGEVMTIVSDIALFDPLKRNIDFRQHVQAKYQTWLLTTTRLLYLSREDAVHIPGAFEAKSPETEVSGRDLKAERKSDHIHIAHDVHVRDRSHGDQSIGVSK
jgi:hypothetical protein